LSEGILTSRLQTWLWLATFAVAGVVLAVVYPDSYQQDGGHHYLFARFAWKHPEMFVGVWSRPLFTFLYSIPAQLGYPAAKIFTVLICLATAHQTARVAKALGLQRPWLSIPLLFLQPSFFLLSADTLTETLFAFVFIIALRLYLAGRIAASALVASLMILARPEGLFLSILWGIWILFYRREYGNWSSRLATTLVLGSGMAAWWLAAFLITGDPLFIKHNWPPDWDLTDAAYGRGTILTYVKQLPEIAGPLLCVVFVLGLVLLLARRRMGIVTAPFLTILIVHSLLRVFGLFGSAGYTRYFVCVAPAIALVTLAGWNQLADWMARLPRLAVSSAGAGAVVLSALFAIFYVDTSVYMRDAHAVAEMYSWFRAHERPVERLIWSQAYMCILFDRDIWEKPQFSSNKEANLALLRESTPGTLIFWDGDTGPAWYGIKASDLGEAGYSRLRSESYSLAGRLKTRFWFRDWGPRAQEMHLYYKERPHDSK
jgi:hypothetical protein